MAKARCLYIRIKVTSLRGKDDEKSGIKQEEKYEKNNDVGIVRYALTNQNKEIWRSWFIRGKLKNCINCRINKENWQDWIKEIKFLFKTLQEIK